MANYLKSDNIIEKNINIGEIPAILFKPKAIEEPIPTIIFYHGWSSNKEAQRMRGFTLAAVGYQVLMPDAIYHGERNPIKDYGIEEMAKYFWEIVLNNIEEGDIIIEELISKYNANPAKIGVMGHSMGGITSAGIFTHNPKLNTAVILNGSCNWQDLNNRFKESLSLDMDTGELEELINRLDPMNNLDLLINRPMILLNGGSDTVVPPESQESFYNKIMPRYEDQENIKFMKVENLDHFVTTNMMEESIAWLYRHLY